MSDDDFSFVGKVVRWSGDLASVFRGQWFTARIDSAPGRGVGRDSYEGTVVDPGNFRGSLGQPLKVGQSVPNLISDYFTVVEGE